MPELNVRAMSLSDLKEAIKLGKMNLSGLEPEAQKELEARIFAMEVEFSFRHAGE